MDEYIKRESAMDVVRRKKYCEDCGDKMDGGED